MNQNKKVLSVWSGFCVFIAMHKPRKIIKVFNGSMEWGAVAVEYEQKSGTQSGTVLVPLFLLEAQVLNKLFCMGPDLSGALRTNEPPNQRTTTKAR